MLHNIITGVHILDPSYLIGVIYCNLYFCQFFHSFLLAIAIKISPPLLNGIISSTLILVNYILTGYLLSHYIGQFLILIPELLINMKNIYFHTPLIYYIINRYKRCTVSQGLVGRIITTTNTTHKSAD